MQLSVSLFDAVAYPAGWKHQEEITPERRREVICLWIDLPELRLPSPIHLHDRDEAIGRLFQMIYGEAKRKRPEPLLLEQEIKTLLRRLKRDNPNIEKSIFNSIHAVALDTFPGYKTQGEVHSFLENYDK